MTIRWHSTPYSFCNVSIKIDIHVDGNISKETQCTYISYLDYTLLPNPRSVISTYLQIKLLSVCVINMNNMIVTWDKGRCSHFDDNIYFSLLNVNSFLSHIYMNNCLCIVLQKPTEGVTLHNQHATDNHTTPSITLYWLLKPVHTILFPLIPSARWGPVISCFTV